MTMMTPFGVIGWERVKATPNKLVRLSHFFVLPKHTIRCIVLAKCKCSYLAER